MTIEVARPGLCTILQDAGRPGLAHLGVGRSGPFDEPALRIANALCANPPGACGLEVTLLGPTLRFRDDASVAVTGAPLPVLVDGGDAPMWAPLAVRAGSSLTLGAMRSGCRAYLAVHGGFDVPAVLGSRSVDVNAALGPLGGRALRRGDLLLVGATANPRPARSSWWLDPRPWFDDDPEPTLHIVPSPYFERLTETSRNGLFSQPFKVARDSNRVGIRFAGPTLEWSAPIEMISEGCVPGSLQLPPSGQPIAFGPECPVSGGYPRIGHVALVDMATLAQRRPGDLVRFAPCTHDDAMRGLHDRERALTGLMANVAERLRSRV